MILMRMMCGKNNPIIYILMFLVGIMMMFYYLVDSIDIYIYICIVLGFVIAENYRIFIDRFDVIWMMYFIFDLITGLYNGIDVFMCIKTFLFQCVCLTIFVLLKSNQTKIEKYLWSHLTIMGVIHALSVIIQAINPSIIYYIVVKILPSSMLANIDVSIDTSRTILYRSGITPQATIAGFNISIFLVVMIVNYIKKQKVETLIFVAIGVFGLLLTGKRSLFCEVLACGAFLVCLYCWINKEYSLLARFFCVLMVAVCIILIIPRTKDNMFRIILNHSSVEREEIYAVVMGDIKSSPLFGTGARFFNTSIGTVQAHSIYLGVLARVGVMGFFIWGIAMLSTVADNIKGILKYRKLVLTKYENESKKYLYAMLVSLFFQLVFLLYGLTGSPFFENSQLMSLFVFSAVGIRSSRKIDRFCVYEKSSDVSC